MSSRKNIHFLAKSAVIVSIISLAAIVSALLLSSSLNSNEIDSPQSLISTIPQDGVSGVEYNNTIDLQSSNSPLLLTTEGTDSYEITTPQQNENETITTISSATPTDGMSRTYGCNVLAANNIHCDPILYPFESSVVKAQTKKLFAITKNEDDIQFVNGVNDKGQALNFRAYFGEFVNITNSQTVSPDAFSVSFWAKKDSDFMNYGHLVSHVNAKHTAGWFFDVSNTTSQSTRFIVYNSEGKTFVPAQSIPLSSDSFTHIVGTFDGSSVKVFANGKLVGNTPFTGQYIADPKVAIRIGMSSYNFAFPWAGTIDDVRIYNRALAVDEVDAIHDQATTTSSGTASNEQEEEFLSQSISNSLVGHWSFDGHLNDVSSSDNHATYVIQGISMTFTPDGRMLYTEKNTGRIRVMENDKVLPTPFAMISNLHVNMEQGLLGIVVDPDFAQNHYVYAYYTTDRQESSNNNDTTKVIPFNRVVRFTEENNIGKDMTVILDNIPANPYGMHAGGALAFGPDGKLYITVGNAYIPNAAQDKDSLLGKVLRINSDGTIPEDNPYPNSPVYTIGHRNMYGIAIDNNGNGIVTENGDDYYDEINFLVKGGNYGYPNIQLPNMAPELADPSQSILPLRSYWKTIAPAQAIFYTGDKFPELKGKFIVGSYNNGRLYAYDLDTNSSNSIPRLVQEIKIDFPSYLISNAIAISQSPSGDIYYGGYYMYKLQSIDFSNKQPIMAPVQVDLYASPSLSTNVSNGTGSMDIKDLQLSTVEKKIVLTLTTSSDNGQISAPSDINNTVTIRIPKILLDGITSVTVYSTSSGNAPTNYNALSNSSSSTTSPIPGQSQPIAHDFSIYESKDGKDNIVELRDLGNLAGNSQISINGSSIPIISG